MINVLKKDIENNKAMYITILYTAYLISFLINLTFTIYPDGINKNNDKKYYKNDTVKKHHEHNHTCKETYNSIISKLGSSLIVYCMLLFSILHLFLQTSYNQEALIILSIINLVIILFIALLVQKINNNKKHILVFKKGDTGTFLSVTAWFLQILLPIGIFLFNNKIFNLELFNENGFGKYMYILYFVCFLAVITIIILYNELSRLLNYNVTDENLCSFNY